MDEGKEAAAKCMAVNGRAPGKSLKYRQLSCVVQEVILTPPLTGNHCSFRIGRLRTQSRIFENYFDSSTLLCLQVF